MYTGMGGYMYTMNGIVYIGTMILLYNVTYCDLNYYTEYKR